MWVGDDDHFSLMAVDLLVHLIQTLLREFLRIKLEVLVILRVQNIHPVDVYWETVRLEVRVSLHHNFSTNLGIFAEVISKSFNRWHRGMTRDCSQVLKLGFR